MNEEDGLTYNEANRGIIIKEKLKRTKIIFFGVTALFIIFIVGSVIYYLMHQNNDYKSQIASILNENSDSNEKSGILLLKAPSYQHSNDYNSQTVIPSTTLAHIPKSHTRVTSNGEIQNFMNSDREPTSIENDTESTRTPKPKRAKGELPANATMMNPISLMYAMGNVDFKIMNCSDSFESHLVRGTLTFEEGQTFLGFSTSKKKAKNIAATRAASKLFNVTFTNNIPNVGDANFEDLTLRVKCEKYLATTLN